MTIEVMKRYESKYIVDSSTYLELQNKIAQYTELDEYNRKADF